MLEAGRPDEHGAPTPHPDGTADARLPLVSVGIPTHHRPREVRQAIAAILGQTYRGPIQVVVVHDGEEGDPTLVVDDPHRAVLDVVNDSHVRGLTGARNTALDHATGEIQAWCDDDDLWHPTKLEAQVAKLLADPTLLVVGCGLRWVNDERTPTEQRGSEQPITKQDLMLRGNSRLGVHSSTMAVRRSTYDLVGTYNESLPQSRAEDLEFSMRVAARRPIETVPEPLVDVRWDPVSAFNRNRWISMAETAQLILELDPDFAAHPVAQGRIRRRIATNYSLAGEHRLARRWALRALRSNRRDYRSAAIALCSVFHVRIWTLFQLARRARGGRVPVRVLPTGIGGVEA